MITVANIWTEYFADSFVEAHPDLKRDPAFNSLNFAMTLRTNGKMPDDNTFFMRQRGERSLFERGVAGHFLARVANQLNWVQMNRFCAAGFGPRRVDLIHAHFGTTGARLVPTLARVGLPTVVSMYGSDISASVRSPRWVRRYRRMFPVVDRIIVLCETARQRLIDLGCPPEKIIIWNLPAGIESYPLLEPRNGPQVRFLTAARFVEKKGYNILLPAFRRLVDDGVDCFLTIVGYGSDGDRITRQMESPGLQERVAIHDTRSVGNFSEFYHGKLRDSDIFVLPSITAANGDDEGGPSLTLVCAQAAGRPVICTPFPGSEISVHEGTSGLYCRENDVDSLYERMKYLGARPEMWEAMGRRGHQVVQENFGKDNQISLLKEMYRDLVFRRKAGAA